MYEEIINYLLRDWLRRIPPEDLVDRQTSFEILDLFEKPRKIISIVGPRRAGKTYFVYQIHREITQRGYPSIYFSFEDERLENDKIVLSDFLTVVRREVDSKKAYLLLDEIQRIDCWGIWLRRVYDSRDYNVLITGSTSKITGSSLPKAIGGRTITVLVLPLRFQEFLQFKGIKVHFDDVKFSEDERSRLIRLVEEYLRFGGLPEVVLAPTYKKLLILQDYYRTIVSRDIAGGTVRNMELLDKFLKLTVRAKIMSISRLYNALRGAGYKVGKATLSEYLDRAKEAFFVYTVPIYNPGLKARIQMPRKIYVTDTGYITALVPNADLGRLLENAVYLELLRRYWHDPQIEISYWSNGTSEVDFVIHRGTEVLELIQVAYDISDIGTREREIRALKKAMKKLGTKKAVIVTGFQYGEISAESTKIEIIPYWEWERRKHPKLCVW